MTQLRRLAVGIANAVVRRARPEVREWGVAMLREMDSIESDWRAVFWAMGSVRWAASNWKGSEIMSGPQVNRISGRVLIVLSVIALLTVLSGYLQAPQPDEGAAAHIFQLTIVAVVPAILLFLATTDWHKPLQSARRLAFPAVTLVLAFAALYHLEHYWYAAMRSGVK